jgi:hypothetical protein
MVLMRAALATRILEKKIKKICMSEHFRDTRNSKVKETYTAPHVNVPKRMSRCRTGTATCYLRSRKVGRESGLYSRSRLHSVGMGIKKTATSAAILSAALERRKLASSMHLPGTDLSHPRWIGVHMKMDRAVKVTPTAVTKANPA